jgi:L-seryl-tRNA(Ser) seleniumtransferase
VNEQSKYRGLPSVAHVLDQLDAPHHIAVEAARSAVAAARTDIDAGEPAPTLAEIIETARRKVTEGDRQLLRRVINATGVLLHTNLGRAPLGAEQLDAVREVVTNYSNLEFDLATGKRGSRYTHTRAAITQLTGAESALVVNNNAAAVLLMLAALCRDREVLISRGELIEIGGEFRIPDVMRNAGVTLIEVGTTNRTHLSDYADAIGPNTAAIFKVHPSNYKVIGFTKDVPGRELAGLASEKGLLFLHDLGSGNVDASPGSPFQHEPTVADALSDGADLVTFSGDKLLGGPQAGVIAGKSVCIERLERDPWLRALRVDKMTLAALGATFDLHLTGQVADVPVLHMASLSLDELEVRARSLASAIDDSNPGVKASAVAVTGVAGGGALPGEDFDSWAVAIECEQLSADAAATALRLGDPPLIARIENDRLLLDVRTIAPADDSFVAQLARRAFTS